MQKTVFTDKWFFPVSIALGLARRKGARAAAGQALLAAVVLALLVGLPHLYADGGGLARDPSLSVSEASPAASQSYCVRVTDALGGTFFQCVRVNVTPPLTASFVFNVLCCPTMHLDASASTGNIVSYTWDLSWTLESPDRVTTSPTTSFVIREFDRGTITLTDASNRTATTSRNF